MPQVNHGRVSKAAKAHIDEIARQPRGKQLNGHARLVRWQALEAVTTGKRKDQIGTHGRTFFNQLVFELIEHPSVELRHIEMTTPCDEGGKGGAGGSPVLGSIQSLYLMALQAVNAPAEPREEPRLIEQVKAWDWD